MVWCTYIIIIKLFLISFKESCFVSQPNSNVPFIIIWRIHCSTLYRHSKQTSASGLSTENVLWANDLQRWCYNNVESISSVNYNFYMKMAREWRWAFGHYTLPISVWAIFLWVAFVIFCACWQERVSYNMLDTVYPHRRICDLWRLYWRFESESFSWCCDDEVRELWWITTAGIS